MVMNWFRGSIVEMLTVGVSLIARYVIFALVFVRYVLFASVFVRYVLFASVFVRYEFANENEMKPPLPI